MELKFAISPYIGEARYSFNRTFMELKCLNEDLHDWFAHSFNRTFMELKSPCRGGRCAARYRFNRTFMELKYG